jgi:hypothetical protein
MTSSSSNCICACSFNFSAIIDSREHLRKLYDTEGHSKLRNFLKLKTAT